MLLKPSWRSFDEKDIIRIRAIILVERDTQKGIVIGHRASRSETGNNGPQGYRTFFEKKIYLQLYIKVEKDWRNRDNLLKTFGYKLD